MYTLPAIVDVGTQPRTQTCWITVSVPTVGGTHIVKTDRENGLLHFGDMACLAKWSAAVDLVLPTLMQRRNGDKSDSKITDPIAPGIYL